MTIWILDSVCPAKKGNEMSQYDAVEDEINKWYDVYTERFEKLLAERGPLAEIRSFCVDTQTPSVTATTSDKHQGDSDIENRITYYTDLFASLWRDGFASEATAGRTVDVVNPRTAIVEQTYTRYDGDGAVIHTVRWVYFLVKTDVGWRVDSFATRGTDALRT
ncbi:hypothetical protein ACQPW1_11255 [Nocardia sp. CA-128927]|uniref:DUF6841 family protein n=1 Tax=Nocardia sp. CA-128927 TaxID=3239975 RepID=UPI003D9693FB